jgi:glycine/D-amino acid oxidase-like deaminating enzyme
MDDNEAEFALTRYSQQLWDELAERLPADAEFDRCGTIWVAADDDEMTLVRRKCASCCARGLAVEVLDEHGLADAEANLRRGLAGGLLVPGDSVIYPPCVARWLLDDARRHGVELRIGIAVTGLTGKQVQLADGSRISADCTVNAAGHLASLLTPGLPIRLRKGHLVITDRYPGFVRRQLVELGYLKSAHGVARDSVAFNAQPRRSGQVLIGSSRQFDVATDEIEPTMVSRMLARAFEYIPVLARLNVIRSWTGFRAATPDALPLIGPHPAFPGLYLATGHEGLGITTALATAELLTDILLGRTPRIPIEPYSPARFAGERGALA